MRSRNESKEIRIDLVLEKLIQGTRFAISEKKKVLRTHDVKEIQDEIQSLRRAVRKAERILNDDDLEFWYVFPKKDKES